MLYLHHQLLNIFLFPLFLSMMHIQFEASCSSTRLMNEYILCLPPITFFISESPFVSAYSFNLFFNILILFHVCNTFSYFSEDIKGSFGHFPPLPPWSCCLQVVGFDHCLSWQVLRCLRILGWLSFKSGALKKLVGVLGSLIGGWGRGFWLLNVDPAVESDLSCLFTLGALWCLCLWVFSIRLVSFSKERSFKKWNGCQGSGS